jgi:hypothetical protein
VLFGVVVDVGGREGPKRDVWLLADAVAAVEDARSFLGLDLLRVLLIRRLGRVPVPLPVDTEVIKPVVIAVRRRRTCNGLAVPSFSVAGSVGLQNLRRLIHALPFFVRRGRVVCHNFDLHRGQIVIVVCRGTHRWPHRRHVNVGTFSFMRLHLYR